jgi:hypothetical protein
VNALRNFGRFCYDFVVGDDWRLAIGVLIALTLTWIVNDATHSGWWVMPLAVAVVVPVSLWHAVRRRS